MKTMSRFLLVGVGCLVLHAQVGRGAGFDLQQMSARGGAMGEAVVGTTEEASALFYNPANMVERPGLEAMAGAVLIQPRAKLDLGPYGEHAMDEQWFEVPHAYVAWQAGDRWWIGLGEFSRFGLGTRFDRDWPGRFNNVEADVRTFSLNPNVAYRIDDEFSVAAGFEAMYMDIKLVRALPPPAPPVLMQVTGDSWGYGGDLALSWKPASKVGVGLVYRLPVRQTLEGTGETPLLGGTSQDAQGTINLPATTTLGVNVQPLDRLTLGVSATYTQWSSYDALGMRFDPDGAPLPSGSSTKNWSDVWRFGAGGEYKLTGGLALQAGYVYDVDPIDSAHADYLVPSGDHHIFSLGLGYAAATWSVNASYSLVIVEDATIAGRPAEGVFDAESRGGRADIFGITVSKKL